MDMQFMWETFLATLRGVPTTLGITLVALIGGSIIGLILAWLKLEKIPVLTQLIDLYISIIRATPMILQILIMYSLIPSLLNQLFISLGIGINIFELNPIYYAFIVFTVSASAGLTEIFRSAIQTVDSGQMEAALASGLTTFQGFRRIVFPQALTAAIPNFGNLTVSLVKNTSLVFVMTVQDITAIARVRAGFGYNYIEAYTVIFIVYLILVSLIQVLFNWSEKYFNRYKLQDANTHIAKEVEPVA